MRWRGTLEAVVALGLAGCGGSVSADSASGGQGGSGGATSSPQSVDGIVLNNCAPNDAPALSFELGTSPEPTCDAPVFGVGTVMISLWAPLPVGPGTYPIASEDPLGGSVALVCAHGPSDCVTADHGTLVLTKFDPASSNLAAGSYSVVSSDGSTLTGSFSALTICHNFMGCG
jgi:hypothetical protein